jgi:hypothetical protein
MFSMTKFIELYKTCFQPLTAAGSTFPAHRQCCAGMGTQESLETSRPHTAADGPICLATCCSSGSRLQGGYPHPNTGRIIGVSPGCRHGQAPPRVLTEKCWAAGPCPGRALSVVYRSLPGTEVAGVGLTEGQDGAPGGLSLPICEVAGLGEMACGEASMFGRKVYGAQLLMGECQED